MADTQRLDVHDTQYAQFLEKLAHDDAFRAELQKDPRKVLAGYGVDVGPGDLPEPIELPSKEELQAKLEQILAELESGSCFMIFGFFWRWS